MVMGVNERMDGSLGEWKRDGQTKETRGMREQTVGLWEGLGWGL